MSMPVKIESLGPADVEKVVQLEVASGLSSIGPALYAAKLEDPRELLLVARPLDNPDLIAALFSSVIVIDELQIDNIAVDRSFRGRGIAGQLLKVALHAAFDRGARTAVLEVRRSNLPAIRLYRSSGFAVVGARTAYYRNPDEDALIMSASLDFAQDDPKSMDR